MASTTKPSEKAPGVEKVVIEVEQTDDGVQFSLKGLKALRNLKDTLSPMCCCGPIGLAFRESEKAQAGKQPDD